MSHQSQRSNTIAVTAIITGLLGLIVTTSINTNFGNSKAVKNFSSTNKHHKDINKHNFYDTCQYYQVIARGGTYFHRANQLFLILPYGSLVEVYESGITTQYTKVYSLQYGFGWVPSQHLFCNK